MQSSTKKIHPLLRGQPRRMPSQLLVLGQAAVIKTIHLKFKPKLVWNSAIQSEHLLSKQKCQSKHAFNPRWQLFFTSIQLMLCCCISSIFSLTEGVQFVLELERLHVVHVAVAVEEIAVEDGARPLLGVARRPRLVLVVPVTAVPAGDTRRAGQSPRATHRTGYSCTCGRHAAGGSGLSR